MNRAGTLGRWLVGNVRVVAVAPAIAAFLGARWLVNAIEAASWNAGAARARWSLLLLVVTVVVGIVAARKYGRDRAGHVPPRPRLGGIGMALVCCASLPALYAQVDLAVVRYRAPHLNDIPLTTMAAARAMAAGQNPYMTAVDPRAESREQGKNYNGLKYMPMMAVAFAPAALANSERGVILVNTFLHVLAAWLIFLAARSLSGEIAAWFALTFYLSIQMVPRQLFGPGVTDYAAVVPLLAAFVIAGARPFLAGLLVGVSLSTKLVPALSLAAVLAPAVNPWRHPDGRRYWLGFVCGCLPSLMYFLWSPPDLVSNVLLFNLSRPVDSTSWLDGHPEQWRHAATAGLLALFAAGAVFHGVRRPAPRGRAVLILVMTLGTTLLGPVNHGNYQLWWIPWFAVVLAVSLGAYLNPVRRRGDVTFAATGQ